MTLGIRSGGSDENGRALLRRDSGSASTIKFMEDVEPLGLMHCWWLCKIIELLSKLVGQFFIMINIFLLYYPVFFPRPKVSICLHASEIMRHEQEFTVKKVRVYF